MEDNILKFPGIDESWEEIEATIRSVLFRYGYDKADIAEYIVRKIKEVYALCEPKEKLSLPVPAGCSPEQVFEIARRALKHYKSILMRLVVELIHREIELYHIFERG